MTDDILIWGWTRAEHHNSLLRVMGRLENSGLTLNAKKCKFYQRKVVFFGMTFSDEGIAPTEDKCRALSEVSEPMNVKELRSFLCTVLWSSRFVRDLCRFSEPLWRLLRGEKVKGSISTRCMAYFNCQWNTESEVDAM